MKSEMHHTRYLYFIGMILFLLIRPGVSVSQVNEYLNHNPVWQINSQCADPYPCIQNEDYNYFVNGDTIFNGLTYKKIYRKGIGSYSWMAPPPAGPGCVGAYSYTNTFSENFIRSDNKKMYIRILGDTSEFLLYDFDLVIGDSLPITINNVDPDIVVTAIDSFSTPYGYRKRFTLSGNTWANELLEGIGHSKGLLEPLFIPFDCGFTLSCFSLNDSACYPVPGPTCELNVGISEFAGANESLDVVPNPFSDFTTITWIGSLKNAEWSLYDLQGKKVAGMTGVSGQSLKFYRGKLDAGIYFFKISESESGLFYTGKLLIQ